MGVLIADSCILQRSSFLHIFEHRLMALVLHKKWFSELAILILTRHFFYKLYFLLAVGGVVRAEKVVEPDIGLFSERDGLAVFHRVPRILALLLAVHEAIAETSYLFLFEQREDGVIIRPHTACHPF